MKHITQQQWEELLTNDVDAVIIDVRTPEEQEAGIIKGALCMDICQPESFMEAASGLDKTKNYYVYCQAGGRSSNACQYLDSIGCQQTFNLLGGISLWRGELVRK